MNGQARLSLRGHALRTMQHGRMRCKCGWEGDYRTASEGRVHYRTHLEEMLKVRLTAPEQEPRALVLTMRNTKAAIELLEEIATHVELEVRAHYRSHAYMDSDKVEACDDLLASIKRTVCDIKLEAIKKRMV